MKSSKRTPTQTAEFYGRLAWLEIQDYLWTGNDANLSQAYYYTRYAVRAALLVAQS